MNQEQQETIKNDNRVVVFMRHGMKNNLKSQVHFLKKQGFTDASMSGTLAIIDADYVKNHDNNDLRKLLIQANKIWGWKQDKQ